MATPQPPFQLLEEDLNKLFHRKKKSDDIWDVSWALMRGTGAFLVLYLFFFVLINTPAYASKADYFWKTSLMGQEISEQGQKPLKILQPLQPEANRKTIENTAKAPNGQSLADFLRENVSNNNVSIPSIGVKAPIIWNSKPENIANDLREGVAHYEGTALPGENGNVFITGHSSNYWWDPGKFKQVFALLDKVKEGERLYLTYNNQPYIYQIESIKVVRPSQIEVLNPTDHSVLTLMTCTPVGTTLNRLIVQARQIYPQTTTNKSDRTLTTPTVLPAIR